MASTSDSPGSHFPPGNSQSPPCRLCGGRWQTRRRLPSATTAATTRMVGVVIATNLPDLFAARQGNRGNTCCAHQSHVADATSFVPHRSTHPATSAPAPSGKSRNRACRASAHRARPRVLQPTTVSHQQDPSGWSAYLCMRVAIAWRDETGVSASVTPPCSIQWRHVGASRSAQAARR